MSTNASRIFEGKNGQAFSDLVRYGQAFSDLASCWLDFGYVAQIRSTIERAIMAEGQTALQSPTTSSLACSPESLTAVHGATMSEME